MKEINLSIPAPKYEGDDPPNEPICSKAIAGLSRNFSIPSHEIDFGDKREVCSECNNDLTKDESGDGICYPCDDALYGDADD